jgi:hypothetical protein
MFSAVDLNDNRVAVHRALHHCACLARVHQEHSGDLLKG